ncbi:MAG: hypothetical protein PHD67_09230 [Oscillospiraceae bacterium]|nr:hypothetical protein [Oscillospiraceae bacterium]
MKSIEASIKALEKRAKAHTGGGDYCRKHLPLPVLVFSGEDKEKKLKETPGDFCEICGKPFAPGVIRPVIVFEDTTRPDPTERQP